MGSRWGQEQHGETSAQQDTANLTNCCISLSEVAFRRTPGGLVLQSPLLSAVRVLFPRLFTLPGTDIFVSCSKAPFFQCPTLIFHGAQDGVIHVEHGRRLAQLVPHGLLRQYVEYPDAGHNDMEHYHLPHMVMTIGELLTSLADKEGQV
jgi:fermentation-respiration switch protein FrsA (DUF1100 family)